MRFLCLHGQGTNSKVLLLPNGFNKENQLIGYMLKIFELQTAALRYKLGGDHVYDFIEGSIPCEPAPEITSVFSLEDEFLAFFNETSPASCREILEDLDAYILSSGPFDGVMAFSLGASVAATFIVRNIQQYGNPPFRCAIFFCGGIPGDPLALVQDEIRQLSYATHGEVIGIPTAHIWGKNDPRNPSYGPELSQLCRSSLKSIYVHEGGHEIPGSKDQPALVKTVECIQSTIDRALMLH